MNGSGMTKNGTLRVLDILRLEVNQLREGAVVQSIEATDELAKITFYVKNGKMTVMGARMVSHPLDDYAEPQLEASCPACSRLARGTRWKGTPPRCQKHRKL